MATTWGGETPGEAAAPAPARAARDVERTRPRYSPEDFVALLWRQRGLMLAVFLVILGLGLIFALGMKTTYTADSSLLVRLSDAYVYNPALGDAGRGQAPQNDAIIQSEVEILNSSTLKDKVIRDIGLARIYPALGRDYARSGADRRRALEGQAIKMMEGALKIGTTPDVSVIRLSFSHPDPRIAALVLNTLVDEYLVYRRQVLDSKDTGALEDQRRRFQQQLDDADAAYTRFLADHGIGDFDAEKLSLATLYGQLLTDSYTVQAQLSETAGRLGVTARQFAATPRQIDLSRDIDHTSGDRLAALRVELHDLLGRYRPDSAPVRDKLTQIAAMERLAATTAADTTQRRIGPNPVSQTAETERNTEQAQLASLQGRLAADQRELARVLARRQELARLESQYQDLARNRELLTANVRALQQREQESQAAQALAGRGDDAVRVIQRAYVPTRGTSLRKATVLLAAVFGAFSALCAGAVAAFLSRSYPTQESAERTLGLPVLAAARRRGGRFAPA
ncbi:MAG: GumC family protein [Caulobacteraceae bacterium]|nr:GumC family protein [Caulobacter sp.]